MNAEQVRQMLAERDDAVERAIVALYERQTSDEQAINTTLAKNGIGFNLVDAEYLSGLAVQIIENGYNQRPGFKLSRAQLQIARRKIMKYAEQLVELAALKAKAVTPPAPAVPYVPLPAPPRLAKPCFRHTCPNDRMDGSVLCATCAADPVIVQATNETFLTGYLMSNGVK